MADKPTREYGLDSPDYEAEPDVTAQVGVSDILTPADAVEADTLLAGVAPDQ